MTEVAQGVPALVVEGACSLLGVTVILEPVDLTEPHRADLTRSQLVAPLVQDVHDTEDRSADRALVGKPCRSVDHEEARSLAAGVELDDLGTEPLDHLLLDLDRTRGSRVHDKLEAR